MITDVDKKLDKPLGILLQEADLVSPVQVDMALQDQLVYSDLRIGEILALRGWLKQETADFFAEHLPQLLNDSSKQPIGCYLKLAGLLDEEQIEKILIEQKHLGLKFGALAVLKGWLKPKTVDFFLNYLAQEKKLKSDYIETITTLPVLNNRDTLVGDSQESKSKEKEFKEETKVYGFTENENQDSAEDFPTLETLVGNSLETEEEQIIYSSYWIEYS